MRLRPAAALGLSLLGLGLGLPRSAARAGRRPSSTTWRLAWPWPRRGRRSTCSASARPPPSRASPTASTARRRRRRRAVPLVEGRGRGGLPLGQGRAARRDPRRGALPRREASSRSRCGSTARAVERFAFNDTRHRYRIALPAAAQQPGDNRLRFVFAATASPADADPKSLDRRQLAAAFYALVTGPATRRVARRPARRATRRGRSRRPRRQGVPSLTLVGPALVRFALRLPPGGRAALHAGARGVGARRRRGGVLPRAARGRARRRARDLEPRDRRRRQAGGGAGGAAAGAGGRHRADRPGRRRGAPARASPGAGSWRRACSGTRGGEPLEPQPISAGDDARADSLRKSLAGANVLLRHPRRGPRAIVRHATATRARRRPRSTAWRGEGVVFERVYTPAVYTLGAMSSVWTSQYPDRHHSEVSFSARLPKDRLTLAELLSAQGVHTAGFVANAVAGSLFGFDRGFSEFHEVFRTLGSRGDVFRQVLPGWLEKHRDRRFFAYVHFREPHFPYDPEPPFDTRFGPDGPIPKAGAPRLALLPGREPGPAAVQPGRARAPGAALRRQPRLRRPGDRRARAARSRTRGCSRRRS